MRNNQKIVIIDTQKSGHHLYYAKLFLESVRKEYNDKQIYFIGYEIKEKKYKNINFISMDYENKNGLIKNIVYRTKWFLKIVKKIKKINYQYIHFLMLDRLLIVSPFLFFIDKKRKIISGTLHHFPSDLKKKRMKKLFFYCL